MTTTTMHFGPEWMRTKGPARPAPSPPLATSPVPPGMSTYSALVTPTTSTAPERRDMSNPFRYSREEMLRIYKEGGGKGGLGLEVERWDGIVREVGCDPVGLKEMSDGEKKIFSGPLNSEIRRRQPTDGLSPLNSSLGERPKLGHSASTTLSPMRERMGGLMGRRRDSTEPPPLTLPRKLSLSSVQGPLTSPREAALPSPRTRIGLAPGFDGVLSESWSSRRRASEHLNKPHTDPLAKKDKDEDNPGNEPKGADVKEEEGEHHGPQQRVEDEQQPSVNRAATSQPESSTAAVPNKTPGSAIGQPADSLNSTMAGLSLGSSDSSVTSSVEHSRASEVVSKPPGLEDLASIEWSYLDPQGQVQGPFRADIMQRWYDEGYFTPNLLMKRTHLDTDWISVGEIAQRASGHPVFLTPGVTSAGPPGLPRRSESLLEAPSADRLHGTVFQGTATGNLRSSTYDSFLQNSSSASASPSSSFSPARFVNASPDSHAFDGRGGNYVNTELAVGSRLMALSAAPTSPISVVGQRRGPFTDSYESSPALHSPFATRAIPMNGLGISTADGMSSAGPSSPFVTQANAADTISISSSDVAMSVGPGALRADLATTAAQATSGIIGTEFGPSASLHTPTAASRVINRDVFSRAAGNDAPSAAPFGSPFPNGNSAAFSSNGQPFSQNHSLGYTPVPDGRPVASLSSIPERQTTTQSHAIPTQQFQHSLISSPVAAVPQSPWAHQHSAAVRRPGPFDVNYPTASNTVITGLSTTSQPTYGRAQSNSINEASPWNAAPSRGSAGFSEHPSNLTIANLGQHDQQQQRRSGGRDIPNGVLQNGVGTISAGVPAVESRQNGTEAVPAAQPTAEVAPQKVRRKSQVTASAAPLTATKVVPAQPAAAKPPSPIPPTELKPAWTTDDDKKGKPSGATPGLREIQEAEMKKLEARRAAEREKERALRVAASNASQMEDFQPFTASWGLPTSQAHAARLVATVKEAPGTAPTTPAMPVWTNSSKAPVTKKSMKEIQEEEERRKKQAIKEKETVAAAAKRGYAETMTKAPAPTQPSGGAWTTVGSAGKTSVAVVPAARPAIAVSTSTKVVPRAAPATSAPSATTRSTSATAVPTRPPTVPIKVATPKAEEFPAPPSHEFMKWLADSLKGLNSSVNFEEITSMLLSFPLDPDPSTIEIISDLIYASSTTLDGRRFASEFVSRRKADAASRLKNGASSGSSAKPLSIADVVKAQPKQTQSEWGGFKVVNKKKKGGRA
ncbi:uncharacterized protein LAESUDRAFT_736963 [Laetiporus sulphureus 93-53]|uniref:GYF domain-containing protein n=1 Tax=Laetiporus sulphureus 93-53 TaxID=1314785 RepID=A0A165E428_9APHY|nr:uncharacterized protein LAESUDRAFT_736963 [Laetiporus sulphureus 93-53]KZT06209.1 hypothetical protein LAESUDRAFT_736963 [Laetiporus sulphureus 93-53]